MTFFIDLDGTLIDSKKRHYILIENLLKKYDVNITINKKEYLKFKENGNNNYKYLTNILKIDTKKAKLICREWKEQIEDFNYIKMDELYFDTLIFLEKIKKNNKIIYLTARQNTINLIKELKMLNIYNKNIFIKKVNPKFSSELKDKYIKKYIKKTKEDKINYCIIGDTENELHAALNNNISFYILNRGFRSKEYLEKYNIKTYNDLEEIYERIKLDGKL